MFRRSLPSRAAQSEPEASDGWTKQDHELLAKKLKRFRNIHAWWKDFCAPEFTGILERPANETRDVITNSLTNVNIIAALIFSSILGNALDPLESDTYPTRELVYNCSIIVVVMLSGMTVTFTTYHLHQLQCLPDREVHRAVLNMGCATGIAVYYFATVLMVVFCLFAMVARIWIHYSDSLQAAWAITAICIITYLLFHCHFFHFMEVCYPQASRFWTRLLSPLQLRASSKRLAEESGKLLADVLESKFQPVLQEQEIEYQRAAEQETEEQLVKRASGGKIVAIRCEAIAEKLRSEGLTTDVIQSVAVDGGAELLWRMLDYDELELKHVEKVLLVKTLLQEPYKARQKDTE